MTNHKLEEYIDATKSKGASDEFLTTLLVHNGWPEEEVLSSLGRHWQQITGLPVPERTGRGESSREAFLYLLMFSTLATWASSLGSMLFRMIDYWFPDALMRINQYQSLRNLVTWQVASIAVAFPIFLLVVRIILSEAQLHPGTPAIRCSQMAYLYRSFIDGGRHHQRSDLLFGLLSKGRNHHSLFAEGTYRVGNLRSHLLLLSEFVTLEHGNSNSRIQNPE